MPTGGQGMTPEPKTGPLTIYAISPASVYATE
jgi:hypothetical protein